MTSAVLDWDDLLDDFEDRIEAIREMAAGDELLETIEPFTPPDGAAGTPDPDQIERFRELHAAAVEATHALLARRDELRREFEGLQRGADGRRHYVAAGRR